MQMVRSILIALSVVAGGMAHAEDQVLHIATGEYAPFADSTAEDGGLVNALVEEVAAAAGYTVEFDYMPWMRGLELTRSGRYSAASYWFYREEREADFIHVGPVVVDRMVLFRRVDRALPAWTELTDLAGVQIGAVTGYTYTPDFWELAEAGEISVQTAQTDEANLRKLFAGRIDVFPMSEEVGRAMLMEHFTEEERAQITIEDQPLLMTEGYLLVSRQAENAAELAQALQNAIDSAGQLAASNQD